MWWIKAVIILIVLLAVGGLVGGLMGGGVGASVVEVAVLGAWVIWVWRERGGAASS